MIKENFFNDAQFPLIISPAEKHLNLKQWITENKTLFDQKLHKHGAILFRGFNIENVENFQEFVSVFNSEPLPYLFRSSPRSEIKEGIKNIYRSTTYPKELPILGHNESSYSRVWGMKIIFCCLQCPMEGGETPITDSRKVLKSLPPALIEKFRAKGVKYIRNLFPSLGLPWKEVFQTEEKEHMKSICNKYNIEYKFLDGESVRISWRRPAIGIHPTTNEEMWFNHSLLFSKFSLYDIIGLPFSESIPEDIITQDSLFGDGTEITLEEYLQIKDAFNLNTVSFKYEKGDVLLLDNMLSAHGRNPFKGERLIATSIIEPMYEKGYELIA